MLYKLLLNNKDGKIYNSIKSIYIETMLLFGLTRNWRTGFIVILELSKGITVPRRYSLFFVDDFVRERNDLGLEITVNDAKVSVLLYAVDICLHRQQ